MEHLNTKQLLEYVGLGFVLSAVLVAALNPANAFTATWGVLWILSTLLFTQLAKK